jgi:hypothetical protein
VKIAALLFVGTLLLYGQSASIAPNHLPASVPTSVVSDTNVTGSISGNTFTLGWTGTLAKVRLLGTTVFTDQANTYSAGSKQTFAASASTAGVSFAGVTANPSSPAAGDLWLRTDLSHLHFYDGTAARSLMTQVDVLGSAQMPVLTGDVSNSALAVTVNNIHGTSVPTNSAAHQVVVTTGPGVGAWKTIPDCQNGSGFLNYTQSSDAFSCNAAAGAGTVTSFSAGTLSPLFTTSVATATSTPALSFSLSNAAAHTFLGNNTGSTAAPTYVQPAFSDLTGSASAGQMPTSVPTSVTNDTNVTGSIASNVLTLGWTGTLAKGRLLGTVVYTDQANSYSAGSKQTVSASATTAGFNFAGVTANPSSPATGDVWLRSDLSHIHFYDGSAARSLMTTADVLASGQMPTFTGDVSNSGLTMTVTRINGTSLAGLATGILKNTTTTGVPSIATAGTDYLTPSTGVTSVNSSTGAITGVTKTIASGTLAMGTSAIASGACSSAETATATGVVTTDVVTASFNGDPTGVTGYTPSTNGALSIAVYPGTDQILAKACNATSASITPGSLTLNWRVAR